MEIFVAVLLSLVSVLPARAADISVQQLCDLVASADARGQSDKKIACKIAYVELTQRQTDNALAALLQQASGPLARCAKCWPMKAHSSIHPLLNRNEPAPPLVEQKASLEKARNYTISYIQELPNFFCTLVVRRFDNGKTAAVATGRPGPETSNTGQYLRFRDPVIGDLTITGGRKSTKSEA